MQIRGLTEPTIHLFLIFAIVRIFFGSSSPKLHVWVQLAYWANRYLAHKDN